MPDAVLKGLYQMIRIRDIAMPPEHYQQQLSCEAARILKISASKIKGLTIARRSVDARKKPDVRIIYTIDVRVEGNEGKIVKKCGSNKVSIAPCVWYRVPHYNNRPMHRPVIIGFGPAGMFAGLVLAMAGLQPLILERGEDAQTRSQKVQDFFNTGTLDVRSNVQFGEGGAGTFSDGKLNTNVNNLRIHWILEQLVQAGAAEDILFDANPHVGTDVLLTVVQSIRKKIQNLGGEIRFASKVVDFSIQDGAIEAVITENGEKIPCNCVITAIGHSARDTFLKLNDLGIAMEAKPFSMGIRIEHPQSVINMAQYGQDTPLLPPANYKLVKHLDNETVYTFCMCPGGYVVAAASEEGKVVTNGMSYAARDGENANAALLVTINPSDFPGDGPLSGMHWQEEIEAKAFQVGGCNYYAPAQLVGDFLNDRKSVGPTTVNPTYKPGVTWCDLRDVLPEKITSALKKAIVLMDKNISGFAAPGSVMTAPETRSSSPVRILRDDKKQSVSVRGLFPAGEGAGYAGGIMSAAIDGMLCAEALIASLDTAD